MPYDVINCTVYSDNPYHDLLYGPISDRYRPVRGTMRDAVFSKKDRNNSASGLVHVHWEEHIIRPFQTRSEALVAAQVFSRDVARFKSLGGRLVWTVHNLAPHEQEHPEAFAHVRETLCAEADKILIHASSAIMQLSQTWSIPASKFFLLPHPSYLGLYARPDGFTYETNKKTLLIFGKVRRYKGIRRFIETFFSSPLPSAGYRLRVSGEPLRGDNYGDELIRDFGDFPQLDLDFRRITDEELGGLFDAALCLVLPYERFMTSGVLMAAMTLGLPIIAPDLHQVREVLPPSQLSFLFDDNHQDTVIDSIQRLSALSKDCYQTLQSDLVSRAHLFAPDIVSNTLALLFDDIIEQNSVRTLD